MQVRVTCGQVCLGMVKIGDAFTGKNEGLTYMYLLHLWTVLEYVEGRCLFEGAGPPGGLGEATARPYFRDIVAGLMYLHARVSLGKLFPCLRLQGAYLRSNCWAEEHSNASNFYLSNHFVFGSAWPTRDKTWIFYMSEYCSQRY